ncbi:hypothetical protein VTL71DRAFT_14405 [Oculimacula yallundae]|uniref:Uncharacterized protein n=1 Tax=Oculimacula yallundae TaxID=86028 RepID=A0ABR4CJR0_9HELO
MSARWEQQVDGETTEEKAARVAAARHEFLEDEAYWYYMDPSRWLFVWAATKHYIAIFVLFVSWGAVFAASEGEYSVSFSWKNFFTLGFGEFRWSSVGSVFCLLLGWVVLHIGWFVDAMSLHVNVDKMVRESARKVWDILRTVVNNTPLVSHLMKTTGGENAER